MARTKMDEVRIKTNELVTNRLSVDPSIKVVGRLRHRVKPLNPPLMPLKAEVALRLVQPTSTSAPPPVQLLSATREPGPCEQVDWEAELQQQTVRPLRRVPLRWTHEPDPL